MNYISLSRISIKDPLFELDFVSFAHCYMIKLNYLTHNEWRDTKAKTEWKCMWQTKENELKKSDRTNEHTHTIECHCNNGSHVHAHVVTCRKKAVSERESGRDETERQRERESAVVQI